MRRDLEGVVRARRGLLWLCEEDGYLEEDGRVVDVAGDVHTKARQMAASGIAISSSRHCQTIDHIL
jgi:hypothetical protein